MREEKLDLVLNLFACIFDFFLSGQEDENVTRSFEPMDRQDGPYCGFDVILLCFFGIEDLDRVRPPGYLQQRHQLSLLQAEIGLKLSSIKSGRHDDQPKVRSLFDELFEEGHEDIRGEGTFVDFVEDYGRVTRQHWICHCLAEKHTVRHVFEESSPWGSHIFKPNRVPDFLSERDFACEKWEGDSISEIIPSLVVGFDGPVSFRMGARGLTIHLLSYTLRHGRGGDPPGLGAGDGLPLEVWLVTVAHELRYPETIGNVEIRLWEDPWDFTPYCVVFPDPVSPT